MSVSALNVDYDKVKGVANTLADRYNDELAAQFVDHATNINTAILLQGEAPQTRATVEKELKTVPDGPEKDILHGELINLFF